ncbi:MAG: cation diffusion facilitator family transporter [Planctomycetaceae bacterium]
MSHGAHHHHDHHVPTGRDFHRAFAWGIALNVGFTVVEAGFGIWSNSLALLADAGHNFSDVLGLLIAWAAHYLAQVKPSRRRTYGWRSSSILAALLNSLILLVAIGGICWEAIGRLQTPAELNGLMMTVVASIGVIINTLTAWLFMRGRKDDLNIKGAFLHMTADAAISGGVVFSGLLIHFTGWSVIDPLCSLAIALVILVGTWSLFRESVNLILHAVPEGIDPQEVTEFLEELPGVVEVHDLHIWAMSTTETALTVHLVMPEISAEHDSFLSNTTHELLHRFGIDHATIQIERGSQAVPCPAAPSEVV